MHVLLLQEKIMLRGERVFRARDFDLDGANDRTRLRRRHVGSLEDFQRFGLHRHG